MPTEAEWEYAARADTKTKYSWGKKAAGKYAWYDKNAYNIGDMYAHKVGAKKPNPWGLYDMHGNVWEWVQDWYGKKAYSNSAKNNPTGPSSGQNRVYRGGSWVNSARSLRSATRNHDSPDYRDSAVGFRLLRKP